MNNRFARQDVMPGRCARAPSLLLVIGLLAGTMALAARTERGAVAGSTTYYVSPAGADGNSGRSSSTPFQTIQRAVDRARPGDVIVLAPGDYFQDVVSRRDGTAAAPITLTGPQEAVVRGGGAAHVAEINHDHIALEGFTIDGLWGPADEARGYRSKLLYVAGVRPGDGVSGLKLQHMIFRNAGGECVRLRYFAQHNEIASSTFRSCGVYDFRFGGGGKNGEALYIGTAPEQRGDGTNPTTEPDRSNNNWVHHNTFDTQGNECVDIKEAASNNIVEYNVCTGQRDAESGGFSVRGNSNVLRYNTSYGNAGAGIRLGGDSAHDGVDNLVYANQLYDNQAGGIKLQRAPQARLCGNMIRDNGGPPVIGAQRRGASPTTPCGEVKRGGGRLHALVTAARSALPRSQA